MSHENAMNRPPNEKPLRDEGLCEVERRLSDLVPRSTIDRERLMYEAGFQAGLDAARNERMELVSNSRDGLPERSARQATSARLLSFRTRPSRWPWPAMTGAMSIVAAALAFILLLNRPAEPVIQPSHVAAIAGRANPAEIVVEPQASHSSDPDGDDRASRTLPAESPQVSIAPRMAVAHTASSSFLHDPRGRSPRNYVSMRNTALTFGIDAVAATQAEYAGRAEPASRRAMTYRELSNEWMPRRVGADRTNSNGTDAWRWEELLSPGDAL